MQKSLRSIRCLATLTVLILLTGCAQLRPNLEPPQVSLTSIRLLPSQNLTPRFEIGLHIINPNLTPLPLKGLAYSVKLEGHQLLSGVTHDLPLIQGYGEGDILLQATADLLNGLQLLTDLMNRPRQNVHYEFEAKLDIGALLPNIQIQKRGEIQLQPPHQ